MAGVAKAPAARAGGGPLGRIATELGLQFDEVGKDVGLAPELVGGWLAMSRSR